MLAASAGDAAMVACLLAHGADVALTDPDGYSATHWLCVRGDHSAVLALLLDAGADINARTNFGSTPLIIAAKYGYAGCAVLLIDRGGDVLNLNARAGNGQTALHEAAKHGHAAIVRLLLQAGARPMIRTNLGELPFHLAYDAGHKPCAALLLAAMLEPWRPCSSPGGRASFSRPGNWSTPLVSLGL